MNDIDGQNAKFSDDDEVQITDLDVPDSLQHRRLIRIIGGLKVPWVRNSIFSVLILIVLGAFFLQWRQFIPTTPNVAEAQGPEFLSATTLQGMVFIQDTDHVLTAYQAATGGVRWHVLLPNTATIDAEGKMLFCYFTTPQNRTKLEALDTNTGKVIWQDALPASSASLLPSPIVKPQIMMQKTVIPPGPNFLYSDNTLYVQSVNNIIYKIQATTGYLSRTYQAPTINHPTVDGQIVYALQPPISSTIQAFRLSDGQRLWTDSFPTDTWAQAEREGVVYLNTAAGTTLIALRGSDGHKLWSYYASVGVNTLLNAHDGIAYMLQQDATLVSIRISDGTVLWRTRFAALKNSVGPTIQLLADQNNVLLYDALPKATTPMYVLRASDGHLLWHTSGHVTNPVALDGTLYVMQSNGQLDAWRESDGYHLWSYRAPVGTSIVQNTHHDATLLFLLDDAGTFYTLRTSNGKLLWHYH